MDQRINEEIVKLTEGTQGAFQAISRRFDGLDEKQKILDRRLTQVERKLDRIVHLLEQQTVQAAQPAAPPAVAGNEEAYDGLPGCCKYDHEMAMNQSGETKSDEHSNHDH